LYNYFQKSQVFLYPLLGIPKSVPFKPNTYITNLDKGIKPEHCKLTCVYEKPTDESRFYAFEARHLLQNRYLEDFYSIDTHLIYIFTLVEFKADWYAFINGKYSMLSARAKKLIDKYHTDLFPGRIVRNKKIVESLFPNDIVLKRYSEELNVSLDLMEEIGEVCDIYNEKKETFGSLSLSL
jgi:hypothetical protein